MCLCLFAINAHDRYPLVLLANRDEYRDRSAASARFWTDHPQVLAGRDLQGMGTWLGVNKAGKVGFLTNYRHPAYFQRKGPTRGTLVSQYLISDQNPLEYLNALEEPEQYNGFNLVVGNTNRMYYYSNVQQKVIPLESGVHGLSNAFLNTSWPKVDDGKERLRDALRSGRIDTAHLFSILRDDREAGENELPDTGVGPELEKTLSRKFINTPDYGTVCSTVIKVDREGLCQFEEKTFDATGAETGTVSYQLKFEPSLMSR